MNVMQSHILHDKHFLYTKFQLLYLNIATAYYYGTLFQIIILWYIIPNSIYSNCYMPLAVQRAQRLFVPVWISGVGEALPFAALAHLAKINKKETKT